jgi:hypothetical protein
MTLQRSALSILTNSLHSRYFLSRSCTVAGFRRMATDSGATNTVSVFTAADLSTLNTLVKASETNTVV